MKGLIKYELKELIRRRILLVTIGLFLFGVQQILWGVKVGSEFYIDLVTYTKNMWLPINLIYFPLMIIFTDIFSSEFDVIRVLPISKGKHILSKVVTCLIISGGFYFAGMLNLLTIVVMKKLDFSYALTYLNFFTINFALAFIFIISLAYCLGRVLEDTFFKYSILLVVFLIISNFYKPNYLGIPVFFVNSHESSFEILSINTQFIIHIIIILLACLILIALSFISRNKFKQIVTIVLLLIASIYLLVRVSKPYLPQKYMESLDNVNDNYQAMDIYNEGFEINKYDMKIKLNEKFSNECTVEVKVEKLSEIKLTLYEGFKINSVFLEEEEVDFKRDGDKLLIDLGKKRDGNIKIRVDYSGIVNLVGNNNSKNYFITNTSAYLGDLFEWYPKSLYRGNEKEYKVSIERKSKNPLYSNLKINSNGVYEGASKEIFIASGKLEEREYNGVKFVGNLEQINTADKLSFLHKSMSNYYNKDFDWVETVILTPNINKQYTIPNIYGGTRLVGMFDSNSIIYREEGNE